MYVYMYNFLCLHSTLYSLSCTGRLLTHSSLSLPPCPTDSNVSEGQKDSSTGAAAAALFPCLIYYPGEGEGEGEGVRGESMDMCVYSDD